MYVRRAQTEINVYKKATNGTEARARSTRTTRFTSIYVYKMTPSDWSREKIHNPVVHESLRRRAYPATTFDIDPGLE